MMWSGEGSSSYGPWINEKRCFCFVRSITLTCYDESFSNLVYVFIIICNCVAVIFMMIGWGVSELWPLNLWKSVFVDHNIGILWWIFLKLCVPVNHNLPLCTCHFHDDWLRVPRVMALELVKKGSPRYGPLFWIRTFEKVYSKSELYGNFWTWDILGINPSRSNDFGTENIACTCKFVLFIHCFSKCWHC